MQIKQGDWKFIDANKARGLEINQPVFTKDETGAFGFGKLVKIEQTKDGISRTFEIALFSEHVLKVNTPVFASNITHVCVPK